MCNWPHNYINVQWSKTVFQASSCMVKAPKDLTEGFGCASREVALCLFKALRVSSNVLGLLSSWELVASTAGLGSQWFKKLIPWHKAVSYAFSTYAGSFCPAGSVTSMRALASREVLARILHSLFRQNPSWLKIEASSANGVRAQRLEETTPADLPVTWLDF